MSERGSFVTEYIYCPECFSAVKRILGEFVCSIPLNAEGKEIPIIAGLVQGLYSGEEREVFNVEMRAKIEAAICHSVRVAVIPDADVVDVEEALLFFDPIKPIAPTPSDPPPHRPTPKWGKMKIPASLRNLADMEDARLGLRKAPSSKGKKKS